MTPPSRSPLTDPPTTRHAATHRAGSRGHASRLKTKLASSGTETDHGHAAARTSLWRQSMVAIIDQAWVSLLSLAVGLLLIRLASPEDYGIYTQLFAGGVLAVTICEAVWINPLMTLAAALATDQREAMADRVSRQHRRLCLGLALAFGAVAAVVLHAAQTPHAAALACLFAAYVFTSARREFQRSLGFLRHLPRSVLSTDLNYGFALTLALSSLLLLGAFSLSGILAALVLANIWALWRTPRNATHGRVLPSLTGEARQLWSRGLLGLPGALASWVTGYSYVFFVAALLGAAAAAELNAARLLFMPTALLVIAWSRVARPRLSRLIAAGQRRDLIQVLTLSSFALLTLILLYVSGVWLALPWLSRHVLGPEYASATLLLGLWVLYFALYAVRGISAVFMLCADRYRLLLTASMASLGVLVVALPLGLYYLGTGGAIVALIAVEVTQLLIMLASTPATLKHLFTTRA